MVGKWTVVRTYAESFGMTGADPLALIDHLLQDLRHLAAAPDEEWLTLDEAADFAGLDKRTLIRKAQQGKLPSRGRHRARSFRRGDLPRAAPSVTSAHPTPDAMARDAAWVQSASAKITRMARRAGASLP